MGEVVNDVTPAGKIDTGMKPASVINTMTLPKAQPPVDRTKDIYGRPKQRTDQYGRVIKTTDIYGRPNQERDYYGRVIKTTDLYGRPAKRTDRYGMPIRTTDLYGRKLPLPSY